MAILINGDGYEPVTAQQDADLFTGIFGNGLRVLNVGGKLTATIISATCVRIADGEAIMQGRRIHVEAGTYDDFTIPAGEQGATKYYAIGYEIYRDVDTDEKCRQFIQEVADASATVPVGGVMRDGATSIKVALYRVEKVGVNIGTVTALFDTPRAIAEVYPVGAIYISANPTNPSLYFGGTWTEVQGKFLLGRSSGHEAGSTGGAETKTLATENLPAHSHTGASHTHTMKHAHGMPKHNHTGTTHEAGAHAHSLHHWLAAGTGTGRYAAQGAANTPTYITDTAGSHTHTFMTNAGGADETYEYSGNTGASGSGNTGSTGSGTAFSIMPPFLSVYIWKRTA